MRRTLVLLAAVATLTACRPASAPDPSPTVAESPSASATPTLTPVATTPAPPPPTLTDPATPGVTITPRHLAPKPTTQAPRPPTHPATTKPPTGNVKPGAFCSTAGATGVYNGRVYTCKVSATENRLRWRR